MRILICDDDPLMVEQLHNYIIFNSILNITISNARKSYLFPVEKIYLPTTVRKILFFWISKCLV